MSVLRFEDVSFEYAGSNGELPVKALDHVTFSVEKGEFIGLIGHTGSGKSTMIQHMNGLLRPTSGRVLLMDKDLADGSWTRQQICAHIGLVFQYPEYQLFAPTVLEDVMFGPGNLGMSEEEARRHAEQALERVGIQEDKYERSPFDLSGGEKRRVALAGVLAMEPEILVLDEPGAGLDPAARRSLMELFMQLSHEGITVLCSTHSMENIAEAASRILVVDKGRIVMDDTPAAVFSRIDELEALGLAAPEMTYIMRDLRAAGIPVDLTALTVEEAAQAVLKAFGKQAGQDGERR
ncbi:MAG: energy-coupling factor transporter ATPase [Lachnospiraceae bacterium]|jgi:energy-coupling factor transporter ATPase